MNKKNGFILLLFISIMSISASAWADSPSSDITVLSTLAQAMAPAADILLKQSLIWLAVFSSIQFVLTNLGLIINGDDIQKVFAKLMGSVLWIGFSLYVLENGPAFILNVGNEFFHLFKVDLPSPGSIIAITTGIASMLAVAAGAVGLVDTTLGMLLVYILFAILAIGLFFAIKIFMVQLELGLIVMLSPLSFSFLGLKTLRDQGIAPFKALISLAYRILLMTLILSAFTFVADNLKQTLVSFPSSAIVSQGIGVYVEAISGALGAFVLLAYLLYKSDSIAASLAGGSTSMGTGDIASAAAAGAAAGAAIAAGGGAAATAATSASQPMSEMLKALNAAGEVKNASTSGVGGTLPVGQPPKPSLSTKDGGAIGNRAPQPPGGFKASKLEFAPPESEFSPATEAPSESSSGSTAGIGGASSGLEKQVENLVNAMSQPKKDSFGDRLSALNDHVAREQSTVQAHINVNASDH